MVRVKSRKQWTFVKNGGLRLLLVIKCAEDNHLNTMPQLPNIQGKRQITTDAICNVSDTVTQMLTAVDKLESWQEISLRLKVLTGGMPIAGSLG